MTPLYIVILALVGGFLGGILSVLEMAKYAAAKGEERPLVKGQQPVQRRAVAGLRGPQQGSLSGCRLVPFTRG